MRTVAIVLLMLLGACAHPGLRVEDMSNGQHSLTATSPSGGVEGSRETAVQLANAYCDRTHQQPVIASFYDRGGVGPQGEHTSTIIFACAAPAVLHF